MALWAKGAMISLCYWPQLVGKENLPPADEPVVYIPNHCSYLDIFTLSGTVPRSFKYMSKQEILEIPIIGWAMQMAGHIGIKRMDKRSQLEAFKAVCPTRSQAARVTNKTFSVSGIGTELSGSCSPAPTGRGGAQYRQLGGGLRGRWRHVFASL